MTYDSSGFAGLHDIMNGNNSSSNSGSNTSTGSNNNGTGPKVSQKELFEQAEREFNKESKTKKFFKSPLLYGALAGALAIGVGAYALSSSNKNYDIATKNQTQISSVSSRVGNLEIIVGLDSVIFPYEKGMIVYDPKDEKIFNYNNGSTNAKVLTVPELGDLVAKDMKYMCSAYSDKFERIFERTGNQNVLRKVESAYKRDCIDLS